MSLAASPEPALTPLREDARPTSQGVLDRRSTIRQARALAFRRPERCGHAARGREPRNSCPALGLPNSPTRRLKLRLDLWGQATRRAGPVASVSDCLGPKCWDGASARWLDMCAACVCCHVSLGEGLDRDLGAIGAGAPSHSQTASAETWRPLQHKAASESTAVACPCTDPGSASRLRVASRSCSLRQSWGAVGTGCSHSVHSTYAPLD